jgi:hypothetical protein
VCQRVYFGWDRRLFGVYGLRGLSPGPRAAGWVSSVGCPSPESIWELRSSPQRSSLSVYLHIEPLHYSARRWPFFPSQQHSSDSLPVKPSSSVPSLDKPPTGSISSPSSSPLSRSNRERVVVELLKPALASTGPVKIVIVTFAHFQYVRWI